MEPVAQAVDQVAVAALDALGRGDFLTPTNLVRRDFALSWAIEVMRGSKAFRHEDGEVERLLADGVMAIS